MWIREKKLRCCFIFGSSTFLIKTGFHCAAWRHVGLTVSNMTMWSSTERTCDGTDCNVQTLDAKKGTRCPRLSKVQPSQDRKRVSPLAECHHRAPISIDMESFLDACFYLLGGKWHKPRIRCAVALSRSVSINFHQNHKIPGVVIQIDVIYSKMEKSIFTYCVAIAISHQERSMISYAPKKGCV